MKCLGSLLPRQFDKDCCFGEVDAHFIVLQCTKQDLELSRGSLKIPCGLYEPAGPAVISKERGGMSDPVLREPMG